MIGLAVLGVAGISVLVWIGIDLLYPPTYNPNSGLAGIVLDVLKDQELSGYELTKAIQAKYPVLLKESEGALYPTLHLLEELGRIEAHWRRLPGERQRRVYRLKRDL